MFVYWRAARPGLRKRGGGGVSAGVGKDGEEGREGGKEGRGKGTDQGADAEDLASVHLVGFDEVVGHLFVSG